VFWTVILFGVSAAVFVAGLLLVPVCVVRIPQDYFVAERRPRFLFQQSHPALRMTLLVLKNLLGAALAIAGMIMIVTPGPGIIGILVGVALMDLPGKRALERKLIGLPKVLSMMNRLRARYGHPPLLPPASAGRQFA
jgi:hypothetical protein